MYTKLLNFTKEQAAWILFTIVLLVPFLAWLNTYQWSLPTDGLRWFPLLGVWAWGLMWTHYAYGFLHLKKPNAFKENKRYGRVTTWLVLALLLLHPGLLARHQYNTLGILPPDSYLMYVAAAMEPFVYFGVIALVIFLSYEVFMRLKTHAWIRSVWGWVSVSQVIAMGLVFAHGLAIGDTVLYGWINVYWILLGVLLLPASFFIVRSDFATQSIARKKRP